MIFKNGQTSIILRFKLLDSSSATGGGLTGLTEASSGLIISTIADNEDAPTSYSAAGSTIETVTTLGSYSAPTATKCRFKEVDATNHPGLYEFQFSDERFAVSGAKSLVISVSGATNLVQADKEIQLVSDDPYVAKPENSDLLAIDASGRIDVGKWLGTATTLTGGLPDVNTKTIANGIIAAATFAANALDAVWSTTTRLLTAGTNIVLAKGTGVTGFNDLDAAGVRSAVGLASANLDTQLSVIDDDVLSRATPADVPSAATVAQAVWDALTSALTTVGSIGKMLVTNVDAATSTRLAAADYVAPENADIAAIKAKTDNLPASPAATSDIPSAATIAQAVWDALTSVLTTAGSIGKLLVTNIDALISSRLAAADYTAPDNADIAAIKTRTDLIPDQPAAVSDVPTAIQNADALLTRDMSAVTEPVGVRYPLEALRFIRNKWSIVSGILTVFKEDDATSSWTSTVTTDAAAEPVITSDPA